MGPVHGICELQLDPKFGAWSSAGNILYLRLVLEKTLAFTVFIKKYLRPHAQIETNFTVAAKCTNQVEN